MTVHLGERAALSTAELNNLPDSAFAYIQPGGTKDAEGKTVPRSLRHFAIHDAAHVRNALARIGQGAAFSKEATPKVMAAARKFGISMGGMKQAAPVGELYRSVPFEVQPSSDGLTLEGYAAVYNSPTRIDSWEGRFDEVILPGAFSRALSERTPVLMFEHGKHPLVGTMPLGVITRTAEDFKGLHIEARLSDNWLIQPVRDAVRDGAVNGMSFRFTVDRNGEARQRRTGEVDLRSIREFETVPELGPVVFPAYEPTTATVRSLVQRLPDLGALRQDYDSDPGALAQAADAALDEAIQACGAMTGMTPEMQRVYALMMAADTALDALQAALGVPDLDDAGEAAGGRSQGFTGRPARGAGGGDSTDKIRQRAADHDALRLRGIIR